MITVQELVDTYEKNTNGELLAIYAQAGNYTNEAREALEIVIHKRGGIEKLKQELEQQAERAIEETRIKNQVRFGLNSGKSGLEIKRMIESPHLSVYEVSTLVDDTVNEAHAEEKDKAITRKTVIGSVLGGLLGGTIGGGVLALQMIQMGHLMHVLLVGVLILNYAVIKLFTKQSGNNTMVLITSFLFVLYALFVAQLCYGFFWTGMK